MPYTVCPADENDHLPSLRRLVAARWAVLAALAAITVALPPVLDVPLSPWPLLAVLGVGAAFNGLMAARVRSATAATPLELFTQIAFDLATLSAFVFFSGGATNPLVSLLLPPVAIAALTLPTRCVLAIGALAIAAYSALMVIYVPLPLADAVRATRLHLIGMWLTFAVSSVMIAWFVVRMTQIIRQRDAEIAAIREQAMRDERMLALGTLAAGAAHELGTPLASMAVLAGELERDASLPSEAREDIALLRQQIGVCKGIITGLSRRAGADRLEAADPVRVDRWLDTLRQRWAALRPRAECHLSCTGPTPPPTLVADPTLEQAVLNLLNNAANASAGEVSLEAGWDATTLTIAVADHGAGFSEAVLARAGHQPFPAHAEGSGIGLMLARAAVERLNGHLRLSNGPSGGGLARIELPLTTP